MSELTLCEGIGDRLLEHFAEGEMFTTKQAALKLGYSVSWTREMLRRHRGEFLGTTITRFDSVPIMWNVRKTV